MKKYTYRGSILIIIVIVLLSFGGYSYYEENFADRTEYITILHTNDVHGRLEPFMYKDKKELVGGMARRATLIKSIEMSNNNVITVDAGDFAQGTLFFNLFEGIPDVKLMHQAGYDVVTLGNHEFDKGLAATKAMLKQSKIRFITANIRFSSDKELQKIVKPYILEDYNGVKVAIIGLIAKNLKTLVNKLEGVEVLDPVEITKEIVQKINSRADLIVVISHMGVNDDINLAENIPEIDVIIGGHSHTLIKQPKVFHKKTDKTLLLQGGEFGVQLGRLDISVKNKEIQHYYYNLIPVNYDIKADSEIQKEINLLSEQIKKFKSEKAGELLTAIGEEKKNVRKALLKQGSLVTDAIKYSFPDVDIVLQNAGGVRLNRVIRPGPVSFADILELYPFENTVVLLELKGSDLKSVLETSSRLYPGSNGGFLQSRGLEYTINTAKPAQILSDNGSKIIKEGSRVSGIKIKGEPLQSNKLYKIAINDYMYNGGNGYSQFKRGTNVIDTGVLVQDAIVAFLREKSPVSLEVRDKIHIK